MGVRERNQRIVRLKDELQMMLDICVHGREALENELSGSIANKRQFIDTEFLKKLKELSAVYNSLTDCHVRLSKTEKSLDNDLTPEEEKQAVRDYIRALEVPERGKFLSQEIRWHNEHLASRGNRQNPSKVIQVEPIEETPSE